MQNKLRLTSLSLAVVATTLLLGSASAFAANYKDEYKDAPPPVVMPACMELHDGFYIGGQVGYDSYRVRDSATVVTGTALGTVSATGVRNTTGFVGGLFAGYGMYFNNLYYLGAEIFANGSGANQSHSESNAFGSSYGKFSVGGSYGISLLPGIKLNNASLFYIRLGYNRASLKGQGGFTNNITGATGYASRSQWQGGFNYGLGMETIVYQNFSLRGEYTHTDYGSFSNTVATFKPADNQFMLGLIYHFM